MVNFLIFLPGISFAGSFNEDSEVEETGTLNNPIICSNMSWEEAMRNAAPECPPEISEKQKVVNILYYSFDGKTRKGQVVIDERLAQDIKIVFQTALKKKFPIKSVIPISDARFLKQGKWSDDLSMSANNTSAFNYRGAVGRETLSKHAYGYAIDINPEQNPYIKDGIIMPPLAVYDNGKKGTLTPESSIVKTFLRLGWVWGGNWESLKDYQHFEKVPDN